MLPCGRGLSLPALLPAPAWYGILGVALFVRSRQNDTRALEIVRRATEGSIETFEAVAMQAQPNQPGALPNRSMPPGTIIPELVYHDLPAAVAWLCATFGFKERLRIGNHRAQLVFGEASVIVVAQPAGTANESPASASQPPQSQASHSLMVRV